MRVILADDHRQVRLALRQLLEQELQWQLVGEAADAVGLLQLTAQKRPDLLFLDWELPGLPVLQLLRLLHYEQPALTVIAMSSRPEAERQALEAGADLFLSKGTPPDRVLAVIGVLF